MTLGELVELVRLETKNWEEVRVIAEYYDIEDDKTEYVVVSSMIKVVRDFSKPEQRIENLVLILE